MLITPSCTIKHKDSDDKIIEIRKVFSLSCCISIMTIIRKIIESIRLLGMARSRGDREAMTLGRNVIRCSVEREIMLSRSSSSRPEPITHNFTKLALIIPRERAKCENPFAMRADERTTLLGIIIELVMLTARITLVLFVTSGVLTFYLMTRIIYTKAFPSFLLRAIEFLGPTFIKLGQWISTRRDIFPEEVCKVLSGLQRNTSAHSWLYTKYLLETTYGPRWRNLFVKFDLSEPIGSGCCAQVYKAWINTKSTPVAVKILHPGIENRLRMDLTILRIFSEFLTLAVPSLRWLSLPDCVRQFTKMMENQIDMKLEAKNLVRFTKNFAGNTNVIFPTPIMELTHKNILVESFHECASISEYLDIDDRNFQRKLAKIGIASIFQMIFKDNFVHCDLHPGNIFVKKSRVSDTSKFFALFGKIFPLHYFVEKTSLVFLDCGLVMSLDERGRKNLRDVFRSVARGDGEMAGQHIINHCNQQCSDAEGFKKEIGKIVKNHLQSRLSLKNIKVSSVVAEFFHAIVRHQVRQDASFASVILSIGIIEGIGRSLDPEIDVISEVLPFLTRE